MILVNINFKNKQKNYLLDSLLNILIRGSLLKSNSEVNNGDINCRNTEGHTSELAVQFRKNLTNSLGSTSAAGNDVEAGSPATSPVLG